MTATLESIRRYPVKGLSDQGEEALTLRAGHALPGDRRYAIAYGSSRITGLTTPWRSKRDFITLAAEERLALLKTRVEGPEDRLIIEREGRQVLTAALREPLGRMLASQFFAAFLGRAARGAPKIVAAEAGSALTDRPEPLVSIINLASLQDLERVTACPVNPLRFRGNLYLAGLPAWEERTWVGKRIDIGEASLEVVEPIVRCAATNVDPETGVQDLNLPQALTRGFGAPVCGVYARIAFGGRITAGQEVMPSS